MQELQEAINHYLAGNATPEEQQLVNKWYYSLPDDLIEIPAGEQALREKIRDRIHLRLQQTIHENAPALPSRGFFTATRLAAAILVMIGMAGATWFFLEMRKRTTAKQVAQNNTTPGKVIPGGNKAVLTLANGDTILLDNADNGLLSRQGNTKVIKLNNGALTYQASGSNGAAVSWNTITTPRGGQYRITLPDGTDVWLNAASSLRFPTAFTGPVREVSLAGEGYFEVKPSIAGNGRKMPFIVKVAGYLHRDEMKVRVLGTKFNIMAYNDEAAVSTSLLEGSVAASNGADSVMIKPGQRANLPNGQSRFKLGTADFKEILAWKNGEFRFREAGIKDIMRQLCRWYDVEVAYKGDASQVKLSGLIPKTEDISVLLDALQATGKVHFDMKGRTITVQPL